MHSTYELHHAQYTRCSKNTVDQNNDGVVFNVS